jgi:hypothetical protein
MLDGPAIDHTVGDTRAAILRYLREHPGSTPKDIATAIGGNSDTVRSTCTRMHDADGALLVLVERVARQRISRSRHRSRVGAVDCDSALVEGVRAASEYQYHKFASG